jgi:hypothetical protein
MSSELYEKIVSQRGGLESLVARIPGFRGYHEKNARRQADTMLRNYIADRIDGIIRSFTRVENKILDDGKGLSHMSKTREVKSRLQSYRDRVASANPKYSGMFEAINIGSEELDRIYAFDEAQLRYVEELEVQVGILQSTVEKGEDFSATLDSVLNSVETAIEVFRMRDDQILQLGADK